MKDEANDKGTTLNKEVNNSLIFKKDKGKRKIGGEGGLPPISKN